MALDALRRDHLASLGFKGLTADYFYRTLTNWQPSDRSHSAGSRILITDFSYFLFSSITSAARLVLKKHTTLIQRFLVTAVTTETTGVGSNN